jgi:hypothetical protein
MARANRRKLLTAAVGVATVSYVVACRDVEVVGGDGGATSGNLVASGGYYGVGGSGTAGNLGQDIYSRGGQGGSAPGVDAGADAAVPSEAPDATVDSTSDAASDAAAPNTATDAAVPRDAAPPDDAGSTAADAAP